MYPNLVTNYYYLWSSFDGAYSSGQLLQVNYLKTKLGSNFDYTQCLDNNSKFLDPQKLETCAEKKGINLNKMLLANNDYLSSKKQK